MSSVWLCFDGEYSDRHVFAVFSSKELAIKAFPALANKVGEDLQEWTVDDEAALRGEQYWDVWIYDDGHTGVSESFYNPPNSSMQAAKHCWQVIFEKAVFNCSCYARDEQHAIKIASEQRAMSIAKGEKP